MTPPVPDLFGSSKYSPAGQTPSRTTSDMEGRGGEVKRSVRCTCSELEEPRGALSR